MSQAYLVDAVRTAGGRRKGAVSGWHPVNLGAAVLEATVARTGINPDAIEDVIMGCVFQGGEQSGNIARNAILASDLPTSIPGTSIDRQCGSSQQALQFAAQAVLSGTQDVVIAAGVESMTRVPMGSPAILAYQAGMGQPMSDRLMARYPVQFSQFRGAQMLAEKYNLSREAMDAFSLESHQRAARATQAGAFDKEILPLEIVDGDGNTIMHKTDEGIRYDADIAAISSVKPIEEGGLITPANSSQICDGASAVMVVSERALKEHGLTPIARIHALGLTAGDPVLMLDEPIHATKRTLERAGMSISDIDLYEVNEAFASVPLAWIQQIGADPDKLNVNGGAIALGHPLGASGVKLMTTLVHALRARGQRYGLQTVCEGGGMANVTIIEAL